MKLFNIETLCPECLTKIEGWYEEIDGKIYIIKQCPVHGEFKTLFWRDADLYKKFKETEVHAECNTTLLKGENCPFDCGLCDIHEGKTCTAVMEITYKCNMNCPVCFADTEKVKYDPDITQIRKMYETVLKGGTPSIQLSGGEPTVREDLPEIIKMGKEMGFPHIQVNTNGVILANNDNYAKELKDAGCDLIYLQFDGLRDEIYQFTRGKAMVDIKMKAIDNCRKANLGVLLVVTVSPKANLKDIGEIVNFAKDNLPTVRGIHFQPMSYFGRFPGKCPPDEDRCSLSDVMHALVEQTGEMKFEEFSPRKRYDSHCAFSTLYYVDEEKKLHHLESENSQVKPPKNTDFATNTNKFTNMRWRLPQETEKGKMLNFMNHVREYTMAISGMGFQDCWNFDINRVKGCCVHVITSDLKKVPLCAFHLTSVNGERIYNNE
ncbi:MAG: radical SAM (seleno)protein TrsS [Pleomorphochaeta sp.]